MSVASLPRFVVQNGSFHQQRSEREPRMDGERSPLAKQSPALPPLIKIHQAIPVGYSSGGVQMTNSNHSNHVGELSSSSETSLPQASSETGKMPSTPEDMPHPHYRPTVINIPTPAFDPNPKPLVPSPDTERPERMRDWLVRMINSGRFPGLKWLDQEKMIFRVPWIHAKKRDYNQERDAALFREWAIHSGKYGDGSDVTTWKINFRCALNGLKDIIERRELEEPDCRVYQMLPSSGTGRRRKRRRPYYTEMLSYTPPERDVRQRMELASPVTASPAPTVTAMTPTSGPIQVLPIVTRHGGTSQLHLPLSGFTPLPSPTMSATTPLTPHGLNIIPGFRQLVPVQMATVRPPIAIPHPPREIRSISPASKEVSSQPATPRTPRTPISPAIYSPKVVSSPLISPHTENTSTNAVHSMHPVFARSGPVYCPPPDFCENPNAVTVRIMYGSITVHMETFDCSAGARIYYGPLHCRDVLPKDTEEKLFGPLGAHQISLSPRHPAGLAKEIFNTTKRGLILEVDRQNVYVTALCRSVVYFGSSPMKCLGPLRKEERSKVFNYTDRFLPALRHYSDGNVGTPPKPYIILSLGQTWGSERPLTKNLVTIIVSYCKAMQDLRLRNIPIYDELLFEAQEGKDIRITSPTDGDVEAEEFLNPGSLGV